MSAPADLVLSALTRSYDGTRVVDAVDLAVGAGEFVALLGPSGSGKTTTLMMVAGFTRPTSGDISIGGRSVASLPPEQRNIGVVFQNYALFGHMTVAENVAFPLRMRKVPRADQATRVAAALAQVRLEAFAARMPRQLSGGQQQRVALARALVFNPALLLMDEPLGALDRNLREQVQQELRRLHRAFGITILYVTHDQEEALTMADRVALMNGGRLEQVGSPETLYERPANRFVAGFIGHSSLVEGQVEAGVFRGAGLEVPAPGTAEGGAMLVLRPEKLGLAPDGPGPRGRVLERTYAGDSLRFRIAIEDGTEIAVRMPASTGIFRPDEGSAIVLRIAPEDCWVIAS